MAGKSKLAIHIRINEATQPEAPGQLMNPKKWSSLFSSLIALTVFTAAQSAAAEEQVFGFSLGKPLNIPACKKSFLAEPPASGFCSGYPEATKEGTRHTGQASVLVAPGQLPYWVDTEAGLGGITVRLIDGALAGVEIPTRGQPVQQLTLKALTDKYGKPLSASSEVVQNAHGAQFTANTYRWKIRDLLVEYRNVVGSLDAGLVLIGNAAAMAIEKQEREAMRLKLQQGKTPL